MPDLHLGVIQMLKSEAEEIVEWLKELKPQAFSPSCRNAIQHGINYYEGFCCA
jgi:hypothetical protein